MTANLRRSFLWPAMTLAGLTLGGYVVTAWPETAPTAEVNAAPRESSPKRQLAGVVGAAYDSNIFVYELRSVMLIDSIMATPQRVDAH